MGRIINSERKVLLRLKKGKEMGEDYVCKGGVLSSQQMNYIIKLLVATPPLGL